MSALRELPLRLAPRPGEGLDSWIEALAARHGIAPAHLLERLGLPAALRRISRLNTEARPEQITSAEAASGLAPGELAGCLPGPLALAGWLRTGGSRFCPQCLAETDGIWQLRWRLAWVFSCPRHARMLRDACDSCGGVQRTVLYSGRAAAPATRCPRPTGRTGRCGADLSLAPPGRVLTPTLNAAAGWIELLLTGLRDPRERARCATVLADMGIVALWLARRDERTKSARADTPDAAPSRRMRESRLHRDVEASAVLLSRAHHIMAGVEREAITHLRALLREDPTAARIPPPGMALDQWDALAGGVEQRMIRAADPDLGASDRLRMRSMTIAPIRAPRPARRGPDARGATWPTREHMVPQLLWPDWSARLLPPAGFEADLLRAVLSVCLLIPGSGYRSLKEFTAQLNPHLPGTQISIALQGYKSVTGSPSGDALTEVLALLCHLADYLDVHGSPIDYRRRRGLIPPAPIDWEAWCALAYGAGAHPGRGPDAGRHRHAQRYLYQLLTGSDLTDPAYPLAFTSPNDRSRYLEFPLALTPRLRQALRGHAQTYLSSLGIDEPVNWSPPSEIATGLALPGIDLDTLDTAALHQLIIEEKQPARTAAAALKVNVEHVRLAVERLDRPEPQWTVHGPDAWLRRTQAPSIFTREFFEREYVQGHRRLKQIAAETGYPRHIIAECAKTAGITLARAVDPLPIDPAWLRRHYLDLARSTSEIADELGADQMTVARALRRHGITPRPPGVHSRAEMLNKLPPGIPRAIRRAVEGGLRGWERLRRFQITMHFPTVTTAGAYLGITHSSLIHQFQRLEADIGAALFTRAEIGRAQQPTPAGARLIRHLERDDVEAAMADALADRVGFDLPPATVLEDARRTFEAPQRRRPQAPPAPFDDIPLPRPRIGPTALNLLRHLLADPAREFYGLEVHQHTGIDMGTLYTTLKKLEQAGWLASRPEDEEQWLAGAPFGKGPGKRRTYYRFTDDGRRAAEHEVKTRADSPTPQSSLPP